MFWNLERYGYGFCKKKRLMLNTYTQEPGTFDHMLLFRSDSWSLRWNLILIENIFNKDRN